MATRSTIEAESHPARVRCGSVRAPRSDPATERVALETGVTADERIAVVSEIVELIP